MRARSTVQSRKRDRLRTPCSLKQGWAFYSRGLDTYTCAAACCWCGRAHPLSLSLHERIANVRSAISVRSISSFSSDGAAVASPADVFQFVTFDSFFALKVPSPLSHGVDKSSPQKYIGITITCRCRFVVVSIQENLNMRTRSRIRDAVCRLGSIVHERHQLQPPRFSLRRNTPGALPDLSTIRLPITHGITVFGLLFPKRDCRC